MSRRPQERTYAKSTPAVSRFAETGRQKLPIEKIAYALAQVMTLPGVISSALEHLHHEQGDVA